MTKKIFEEKKKVSFISELQEINLFLRQGWSFLGVKFSVSEIFGGEIFKGGIFIAPYIYIYIGTVL